MNRLEQLRAKDAHERAKEVKGEDWAANYRSYVERLGPAILTNGLGQALAFERAAAEWQQKKPEEHAHMRLYQNVQNWLSTSDGGPGLLPAGKDLLEWLTGAGQDEYLAAQAETLAWLSWHKKFCQAYLPRQEKEAD